MKKFSSGIIKFCFLFIMMLFSVAAMSQAVIRGSVKDAGNQPLTGASIQVQGSGRGTTSDASGNFSLNVPPGKHTIIVSYVGLATQRRDVTVSAS
ncbi:MAG TPA: carboxypeptidase-like regulatory domain-containing protein, partial [Segetibacter sp.]